MDMLNYVRLKTLATCMRLAIPLMIRIDSHPDAVLSVPSREKGRQINVHVYRPANKPTTGPRPVLVNLHGSGFILPLQGTDDAFCRRISDECGYVVLDSTYRVAPEWPFPSAFNDVEDVVTWVLANEQGEYDTQRIALSGFSAGGNLAMAVSASMPPGTTSKLLAIYPITDLSIGPNEKAAPDTSGAPIRPFSAHLFNDCYLHLGARAEDPRVSPSHAPAERFPKEVLVVTAAQDNLAPEAEELAKKIEVLPDHHVVWRRMENVGHGFDKAAKEGSAEASARDEAYALAVEMLQR